MIKKMALNILLRAGSILIIIVSCMLIWKTYTKKIINETGIEVLVKIIESPRSCENITTRTGYCKLEYNGEIFIKRAGNKFCHFVSGEKTVKMLTNEKKDELLFIGEYDPTQYLYAIILFMIGVIIIIKNFKANKKYDIENN